MSEKNDFLLKIKEMHSFISKSDLNSFNLSQLSTLPPFGEVDESTVNNQVLSDLTE